ncbi:MFS transporter [Prauserella marina]|uniref:MFS transporter n=1 Tax=Prauserella marina TaxID=530584 RepID=UPI000B828284|nr:MFS transporter [Prauserella marina]ASR33761.1 MFS transporter [Prauserella marina]
MTGTAGRREWAGLAVLLLPCLLVAMDMSVLFFALPFLSADLEPTSTQQLWIADVYGFLLAGLLITMGSIGDRIGRRRLLLIGAGVFGAASILTAYAPSAEWLIVARALLGIGGATLAPSTLSLIRNMFHDAKQRTLAISLWTAGFAGGAALGPIVGGLLLEHFWWGSVFLINVPAMVLLLVLGPILLPEHVNPNPGRFDVLSAVLSLAAVLPVINGIKQFAESGVSLAPVVSIVAGVLVGVLFVLRQRTLSHPMIDLGLFGQREFGAAIGICVLALFAVMGLSFASAQYLQLVLGMRPFTAALWSAPTFVGMAIGTTMAALLARRVRPGFLVAGGMVIAAAGFGLITGIDVDGGLPLLVAGSTAIAVGVGSAIALATDLVVASAPPERAGAASAISETGTEFGGALGMAVLGSIGVAVYRSGLEDTLPDGVPDAAASAASDTLGGAMAVAEGLPAPLGGQLADAAATAYVSGLHVTVLVGAVVLTCVSVGAALLLRRIPASGDSEKMVEPA